MANDKQEEKPDISNGPIEKRECRDLICCILFILSNVFLVFCAYTAFANGDVNRLIALYDSSGNGCGVETTNQGYGYLYFAVPHQDYLNTTICVKECPNYQSGNETRPTSIDCVTNANITTCGSGDSNFLWNEDPTRTIEQVTYIAGQRFVKEIENPVSSLQQWYLTYQTSGVPTTEVQFPWSLRWENGLPIHTPIYYNTNLILSRLCFPDLNALKDLSSELMVEINTQAAADKLGEAISDIDTSKPVIGGSIGIALIVGFLYMLFIYLFSGIIVWIIIILYCILMAVLGGLAYQKSVDIDNKIAENKKNGITAESGQNTTQNRDIFYYLSIVIFCILAISIIVILCKFSDIQLAIAIIKTASVAIKDIPLLFLVPPIVTLLVGIYWMFWIFSFVYLYSVGEINKSPHGPFAAVKHDTFTERSIWYYIFGGLWNNAWLSGINQFVLASSIAIWYFTHNSENFHRPISRSVYRAFRYHLGSIAFGAAILAVVQTIRIFLVYMETQIKAAGGDKNAITRCILKCAHCFTACLERCIKFINKNAYIEISISGLNFCSSAREAMRVLWANAGRVTLIAGIAGMFILIGKIFIAVGTLVICSLILNNVDPYKDQVNNTFYPLLVILIIAYTVGSLFLAVYHMAIDTILLCFLHDEEIQKGRNNSKPAHCPEQLSKFFEEHEEKEKKYKEKRGE